MTDLPKLATGTTSSIQTHSYATSEASTLLPSIALLNEHAGSRYNDPNNAGSLSTQNSLPCHCATLRPLLREFVDALLQLDESVQSLSRSPSRPVCMNIGSLYPFRANVEGSVRTISIATRYKVYTGC